MGLIKTALSRLFPKSRIWRFSGFLDGLMSAVTDSLDDVKEAIEDTLLEAFPSHTTMFRDWSVHFGSPETLNTQGVQAEWAATGGQSPQYFQDILHAAGFTQCFVHEWWVPDSDPVEARNPVALKDTSVILVNDINTIDKGHRWRCGMTSATANNHNRVLCGAFDGYKLIPKPYPCPDIETEYPNYFYVCGETWPLHCIVGRSQYRKLLRLIYKMKPMHLRCVLRVAIVNDDPLGDYDIQDVWKEEIEFQDMISETEEEIQDHS